MAKYLTLIDKLEVLGNANVDNTNEIACVNALISAQDRTKVLDVSGLTTQPMMSDSEADDEENGIEVDPLKPSRLNRQIEGIERAMYRTTGDSSLDSEEQYVYDPDYRASDTVEYDVLRNLDPTLADIRKLPGESQKGLEPRLSPRVIYIKDEVKEAIFELNSTDPAKYHSRYLANMFGLSVARTQAILKLKFIEKTEGYETEGEMADAEVEDRSRAEYYQWDPETFHQNYKNIPKNAAVDEGELALLRNLDNLFASRYFEKTKIQIAQEVLDTKNKGGFYGAPDTSTPPAPRRLSEHKQRESRHHLRLTDLSEAKQGSFRVAVRDKSGVLREPSNQEFKQVRRREKHPKAFFNYTPYQSGQRIGAA